VCQDFTGANRFSAGDSYLLTFPDARHAIAAVERLTDEWRAPGHREGLLCPMGVAVHKGVLYAFRDFLYSRDLNIAAVVERVASRVSPTDTVVLVTGQIQRDLVGSAWDERLQRVDVGQNVPALADIEIYRLGKP
jgi:hypothetical protein